ncbi:hypothetical protein FGG08_003962 [Glutinoglossum americanum]|uniref:Uncharacterized protein n=1 Tax=Glutinoglossum americanum TaxID=1670608 RepID=A0A9P8L020_9PEZI|nr:hypothetical protein FGG08_003962 [Glutinoglossum americanum]
MSPRRNLQTSIPTVGSLCEKLGYGKGKNEVTGLSKNDLTETTQVWRKKYITPSGKLGRELKDWKSVAERHDLLVMAIKYLDDDRNGERFWPNNREDDAGKHLHYPTDEDKIAKILRQLFWKQNYYDIHNAKEERKRASRERSLSGLTSNDPIIVDSIEGVIPRIAKTPPPKYTERASQDQSLPTKRTHETDSRKLPTPSDAKTSLRPLKAIRPIKKTTTPPNQPGRENRLGEPTEQGTPDVYDDIEGGNETSLLHRLPPQTPSGASAISSGNSRLSSNPAKSLQDTGESPSESRVAKRRKNDHQSSSQDYGRGLFGTPLRQSERAPKRRVLPNVASSEEVAALLEGSAPAAQTNRDPFVDSFEESPSTGPAHIHKATTKTPQKSLAQQLKESLVSDNRDYSRLGREPGATSSHEKPQAVTPVAHKTLASTQTRSGPSGQSAVSPNTEGSGTKDTQQTAPEIGITIPKALNVEGNRKAAASDSKSRVEVDFWIIKNRKPRLVRERWREGMLRGKSLSFFIEGASKVTQSRCIEELKCTLQTRETQVIETVHKSDEKAFEVMKNSFTSEIKKVWEKDRNGKENFEIWIEPIYGDDLSADGEAEVEDLELGDY